MNKRIYNRVTDATIADTFSIKMELFLSKLLYIDIGIHITLRLNGWPPPAIESSSTHIILQEL